MAALALLGAVDAGAQQPPATVPIQQLSFDVPAQPLADALAEFGRQSGWQISYTPGLAQGRRSTAVAGTHDPATALGLLLSGTGITWRGSGERS
ncbi:MAG TPA: STN domain-containing protein, partial [Reyranella sp.]|nr:STN domain-containing protein [Reyranella sp.]